jgi:hypothetical protein
MADTYKARTVLREFLADEENKEALEAVEVLSSALYEAETRARSAERTVEAYRTAIADLMANKA